MVAGSARNCWSQEVGNSCTMNKESMTRIEELVSKIKNEHEWVAAKDSYESCIASFEKKYGFSLPEEMKLFYAHFESANLHDYSYCIVSVEEIEPASIAIYGNDEDIDLMLPPSWFAFSTHGSRGDWIMIDLDPKLPVKPIMDLDHESADDCAVIALSFAEFLADALQFGGDDTMYWSNGEKEPYGEAKVQEAQLSSDDMRRCFAETVK